MSTNTPGDSSEADNSSSLNNTSSLVAERGTTATGSGGGGDTSQLLEEGDFDESSIEALNWSEADEEELQLQAQKKAKSKSPVVRKLVEATTIEGELAAAAANLDQSTTSEQSDTLTTVHMLSSSLLQSIDDDKSEAGVKQAKNAVIEHWASEVKEAVERGEMDIEEEEEVEEDGTMEEGDDGRERMGIRKRKKGQKIDEMNESVISSLATESGFDPLSNAPVLDDGPIWDKGPKRYRFQENRRINQKLTWCVLITVVLALGLGLGNLVAYNECETEYKQQQQQIKSTDSPPPTADKATKQSIPPPSAPEVTKNGVELPSGVTDTPLQPASKLTKELPDLPDDNDPEPPEPVHTKPDIETDREQYVLQMEALTNIVKTLDHLQRKIDNFQNHTRRLGGVVVMKDPGEDKATEEQDQDEDEIVTTPNPMDAMWDDNNDEVVQQVPKSDPEMKSYAAEEQEDFVLDLIDGIEETVNYLRQQEELKYLERLEKRAAKRERKEKSIFAADISEQSPEDIDSALFIEATVRIFKRSMEEFIQMERDELRDKKILGLAEDRQPEDYSPEERAEVLAKYDKFMKEYNVKEEVAVEKERLKFLDKNNDDNADLGSTDDDESIDDFFMYKNYGSAASTDDDDGLDEWMRKLKDGEERMENLFKNQDDDEPMHKEKKTSSDLVKSPPSDLTLTPNSENDAEPNLSKEKSEDTPSSQPSSSEDIPSSEKSDGKKKLKKSTKKTKSKKTLEQDEEFGSGNGRKKKRHSSKKERNEKSSNEEERERYKKKEKKKQRQNGSNKPPKANSFKGYDINNNWSVDSDADDDDDDHKRKKYHSKSGEDLSKTAPGKRAKAVEDSNWLLERTKVREAFRNMDGSGKGKLASSGKKAHNWQIDRDSVRRRVRSNKKGEDRKSFGY